MDEMPSAEFRRRYASLKEPVKVTANGHAIGFWTPAAWWVDALHAAPQSADELRNDLKEAIEEIRRKRSSVIVKTAQSQRDELLGKINRGKK